MTQFYTYIHARPNTVEASGIFYVGKGKETRAYTLKRSNPHHSNIVGKYGAKNILVGVIDCSSESIAFELEKGLIKCLKRVGVNLSNLTAGGEGLSGYVPTEETRIKISMASSKAQGTPEAKAKRAIISKRIAKILGIEHFKKMSLIGLANPKRLENSIKANKDINKRAAHSKFLIEYFKDTNVRDTRSKNMLILAKTEEWKKACSVNTKLGVNATGVQDKRRVYLKAKYAYFRAYNIPRYTRGISKEVIMNWWSNKV